MSGQKYQHFADADADDHLVASSVGAAVSYGSPVVDSGTDRGLETGEGPVATHASISTTTCSRRAPAVNNILLHSINWRKQKSIKSFSRLGIPPDIFVNDGFWPICLWH